MLKNLISGTLLIGSLTLCQAQIDFEPAYFINNAGAKTSCFIRNVDWKNNPTSFEYKLTEDGVAETAMIANVKEFKVNGEARYIREVVKMNRSSDSNNSLDSDKTIQFNDEQVFLKTISEGEAKLYYFEENNLRRFFFSVADSEIEPLIYKRYIKNEQFVSQGFRKSVNKIGTVGTYKQQLWNDLKCDGLSRNYINSVKYELSDLNELFEKYNRCKDPLYRQDEDKNAQFEFNVTARPGLDYTSLSVTNTAASTRNVDFDQQLGFRLGIELEGYLPFNKNKWSFIAEPTYHSYKSEKEIPPTGFSNNSSVAVVDYKSIEIPLGFRHYMYLSDSSSLFLNVGYVIDIPLSSTVTYTTSGNNTVVEFGSNGSFCFGMGFKYDNKISIEARYLSKREIFGNAAFATYFSDYNGFSIIFGYSLF